MEQDFAVFAAKTMLALWPVHPEALSAADTKIYFANRHLADAQPALLQPFGLRKRVLHLDARRIENAPQPDFAFALRVGFCIVFQRPVDAELIGQTAAVALQNCGPSAHNLGGFGADFVQSRDDFIGQLQLRRFQVLAQMRDRRSAGNQQNVGRTLQQPREGDLQWCRV